MVGRFFLPTARGCCNKEGFSEICWIRTKLCLQVRANSSESSLHEQFAADSLCNASNCVALNAFPSAYVSKRSYAARDMAKLKSERWQAKRPGIQLLIAQRCTPQREIFVSQFERMNCRARNRPEYPDGLRVTMVQAALWACMTLKTDMQRRSLSYSLSCSTKVFVIVAAAGPK